MPSRDSFRDKMNSSLHQQPSRAAAHVMLRLPTRRNQWLLLLTCSCLLLFCSQRPSTHESVADQQTLAKGESILARPNMSTTAVVFPKHGNFNGLPDQESKSADAPGQGQFARVIKPLLSDRCFKCHGPDETRREADLRLDTPEGLFEEGAGGNAVVVPGDVEASELYYRLTTDDPYERMPPVDSNLSLSPEEIAAIGQWIEAGANWEQHWHFLPFSEASVPEDQPASWDDQPIDRYLYRKMTSAGLRPNDPAARERLIRRVTLDLTGLPPTLEEVDRFVNDSAVDAYERLVDDLLSRDSYGERLASDWLDVSRYADSYGYQVDRDRFVWPWRDWVIRAFNTNLSYDQFMTWQLAGDLLPEPTRDQLLATTFNRLHSQKVEGGSVPEEFRNEYVADRTQTFATAFLGLTMECARCHDHKYDPISQREYYGLYAYFNNIDEAGLYSYFTSSVPTPTLLLTNDNDQQRLADLSDQVSQLETELDDFQLQLRDEFRSWWSRAGVDGPQSETDSVAEQPAESADAEANADPGEQQAEEPSSPPPLGALRLYSFEDSIGGPNQQVEGKVGKAIRLTGDDAFGTDVGNFDRSRPFSVSAWVYVPEQKDRSVIFHRSRAWTDAGSRGYELLLIDGKLRWSLIHFWPGNAISIQAESTIPLQEWTHVVVTYDGSASAAGLQIFANGEPLVTETVRDNLYKNITGGGGDNIAIGQRFRDRGFTGGQVDEFAIFDRQLTKPEIDALFVGETEMPLPSQGREPDEDWFNYFLQQHAGFKSRLAELQARRSEYFKQMDRISEIMIMREMEDRRTTHVLHRGAYDSPTDPVEPGTPVAFPTAPATERKDRLGLANWLTGPAAPMVARVTVNHYWQLMFGRGLVSTPEDFGSQGAPPSHPELLEWLADDFVKHGWDVKRLLKQIALSNAYQQSSSSTVEQRETDPENVWLSRGPRQRLTAEMMRDQALALSGLLVDRVGGSPVRPYEVTESFKPMNRDQGDGLYRRSLYTFWKRTGPAPVMMALDASKRDVCVVKREQTSTPLQSLVLLNDPQVIESARLLAAQILEGEEEIESRIRRLFRSLTCREPDEQEVEIVLAMLHDQTEHFTNETDLATQFLAVGDAQPENSLDPIVWASWSVVTSTLMSLEEVTHKF